MRHLAISLICLSTLLQGADKEALLRDAVATIRYIWREWMEKGDLQFDRLTNDSVGKAQGSWKCIYTEDGEKIVIDLVIRKDGTWSSNALRPDMNEGHWQLSEGMIILFEGPLNKEPSLATAIIARKGVFYLLNADAPAGLIPMRTVTNKTERPK